MIGNNGNESEDENRAPVYFETWNIGGCETFSGCETRHNSNFSIITFSVTIWSNGTFILPPIKIKTTFGIYGSMSTTLSLG